jgi:hypothetical protein
MKAPGTDRHGCTGWSSVPGFAAADVKKWGFNSARLNITWANLEPRAPDMSALGVVHQWNMGYVRAIDAAIASFKSHGLAVILQMTQFKWSPAFKDIRVSARGTACEGSGMPSWLYPAGGGLKEMVNAEKGFFVHGRNQGAFAAALKFVAKRYRKNKDVVGFDVLNEPYDLLSSTYYPNVKSLTPAKLKLVKFDQKMGKAVHAASSRYLVFLEDHKSPRTGRWALTHKPKVPHQVLVDHFYASRWRPDGRNQMVKTKALAKRWNDPLWIGEWTVFGRAIDITARSTWKRSTKAFLRYARKYGLGWAVWVYGPNNFQKASNIRRPKTGLVKLLRTYG